MQDLITKASKIRCLISDLDGVLTDGKVFINDSGTEYKNFNFQDGLGIQLLHATGIKFAIITGSKQELIMHRAAQLNIKHVYRGARNKQRAFEDLKATLNLTNEQFAYIGDDLPDLKIMQQIGFSIAPANAVLQVKKAADWNTELTGGNGAVREACDFILEAQGMLNESLEIYLRNE